MELQNKNVLITGSARGIGLAIAHKFASVGANIILNGLAEISDDVLAGFAGYSGKVVTVIGDVSKAEDAQRMVEEAVAALGSVDVLINNAGITRDKLMLKMTEEDFEQVLKVNLTGTFNMTQSVLKPMTKARQGAIISLSSVVGLAGNVGQANYAASKAGLIALAKSIGQEYGPKGIRANAIAPGFIETAMTAALPDDVRKDWMTKIPLRRGGQTEDIANVATFLASEMSSYVSGQVIQVDGGMNM